MAAGVFNLTQSPLFSQSVYLPNSPVNKIRFTFSVSSIRATSDTPSSTKEAEQPKPKFTAPPNFKPPEPKRFAVRPDKILDVGGASLAIFFRFGTGLFVNGYSATFVPTEEIPTFDVSCRIDVLARRKLKESGKVGPRPEKPIEIYEFQSCPFCRKVREIVSVLDLDVLFYPCPKNGPTFRPKVAQMGGKQQFPFMVDPNTGVSMYESDDIIKFLSEKYGDGTIPLTLSLGLLTSLTAAFSMIGRIGKGSLYSPSKVPPEPLVIWGYEGSPFCVIAREALVELELPHIQRSCARGSPKRQILFDKTGRFQVPYLEDPNTGVEMFESAEMVEFLRKTYAA